VEVEREVDDRRVLVLGGGFVGSNVVRALRARDVDVALLTRSPLAERSSQVIGDTPVITADLASGDVLADAARDRNELVWAVGSLMPSEAECDPLADMQMMLRSLLPTLEVLAARPELGFTLVSSGGTVYGRAATFPTTEDAPTDPISAYGVTRLATEKFVGKHQQIHPNRIRIARVANAYGPGQTAARGQGFIAAALQCAADGTPVTLYGGDCVSRDFVHIDDAASCIASLVLDPCGPGLMNVGSGEASRLIDVLEIVQRVTNRPLQVVHRPARPFDVERVELSIETLRSVMPFVPRPLADGIAHTWQQQYQATQLAVRGNAQKAVG
jgi:UDP-glucose 4-epimerase